MTLGIVAAAVLGVNAAVIALGMRVHRRRVNTLRTTLRGVIEARNRADDIEQLERLYHAPAHTPDHERDGQ